MTPMPNQIHSQEELEQAIKGLKQRAQALTDLAFEYGFVLTINTVPNQPLAMGNYDMQCELRIANDVYRGQHELKESETA
jgi:hypothetical protein